MTLERRSATIRQRREIDLWRLCCWVYHDQHAHRLLKRPIDWFLWSLADWRMIEDGPRPTVARDAATLHAEVLELGQKSAELIAFYASQQTQPEPPLAMPEPYPTTPDRMKGTRLEIQNRTRWGQAVFKGKQEDYLVVLTGEYWYEEAPVWERYGRKGMRQVGTRRVRRWAEYCPLMWLPDFTWVSNDAAVHRDWLLAMNALYDRLEHSAFVEHVIVDFGIEASYQEIDPPVQHDARRIELDAVYPTPEIVVDETPNRVVTEQIFLNGKRSSSRLLSTRQRAWKKRP